jgi:hypothetical protein
LTCCLWAEKRERKIRVEAKAMKSIASPSASLPLSAEPSALAFHGAAEAAPLQNNDFSAVSERMCALGTANSCGEVKRQFEVVRPTLRQRREGWGTRHLRWFNGSQRVRWHPAEIDARGRQQIPFGDDNREGKGNRKDGNRKDKDRGNNEGNNKRVFLASLDIRQEGGAFCCRMSRGRCRLLRICCRGRWIC